MKTLISLLYHFKDYGKKKLSYLTNVTQNDSLIYVKAQISKLKKPKLRKDKFIHALISDFQNDNGLLISVSL